MSACISPAQATPAEWVAFALDQAIQGKPTTRPNLAFVGFYKAKVTG